MNYVFWNAARKFNSIRSIIMSHSDVYVDSWPPIQYAGQ